MIYLSWATKWTDQTVGFVMIMVSTTLLNKVGTTTYFDDFRTVHLVGLDMHITCAKKLDWLDIRSNFKILDFSWGKLIFHFLPVNQLIWLGYLFIFDRSDFFPWMIFLSWATKWTDQIVKIDWDCENRLWDSLLLGGLFERCDWTLCDLFRDPFDGERGGKRKRKEKILLLTRFDEKPKPFFLLSIFHNVNDLECFPAWGKYLVRS